MQRPLHAVFWNSCFYFYLEKSVQKKWAAAEVKVTTGTFLSQAWENKKVGWWLPVQQKVGFTALRRSWKQEGLHFEDSIWLHETPRILLSFELYYCLPELLQLLLNSEQTGNFCVGAIHSKEEGYWNCRLPAGRDSENALWS